MTEKENVGNLLVTNCARCGENHHVYFKSFRNNTIDDYEYWGTCPVTKEPILMNFEMKNIEEKE